MPMLTANGETIHYEKEGSGPVVVLIHGIGGSAAMWKEQIGALKDRYTLVTFDCRGHGRSSANGEVSVAAAQQDLKAVLDHLGVGVCHLVGLSMGGPIALGFIMQWPAMVRSLVLADSFAKPPEGSSDYVKATREAIAYISMQEFGTQYAAEHMSPMTPFSVQDEFAAVIASMSPKAYVQTMQDALLGDFTAALPAVKVPCLVLVGEQDTPAMRSESEFLAAHIAGATLRTIPDACHLCNLDNAAAFNAAISRFLDEQVRGG